MPARETAWYLDDTSLLTELRRSGNGGRAWGDSAASPSIPSYDELQEISRGGQGVVYKAVQRSTRRAVAIKVLLDGAFSSGATRRRFEREIDVVASLRHPNIVRIYDSGVTPPPDERLFFVMEFLEGQPLNEWAQSIGGSALRADSPLGERSHRQTLRNRVLPLFACICEAVNFAHQRGVIHRDLKPGNIRVDEDDQPHVLDFGLAKADAESASAPHPTVSMAGQFLGSLPWASPEQAEGDSSRIDTRSDVYALGVMLHQLLTGRFPYSVEGSIRSVLETIQHVEPTRPSAIDPAADDELDTIVLKCLEKDPARRYQSAGELGRDVRHYLAGEPIEAKRASTWYTMRKTMRRYRVAAAVAAIIMLVLAGGIVATTWQARAAEAQRQRAEQRFDEVRALANRLLFDVHDAIADLQGARQARELLVTTALEYLQSLASESQDDPSLQQEVAAAYQRVGDIQGNPYRPNLGNTAGALESYTRAQEIREALHAAHPQDAAHQRSLANILNQIGDLRQWSGDMPAAVATYERAAALLRELVDTGRATDRAMLELAATLVNLGDARTWSDQDDAALERYSAALPLLKELAAKTPEDFRPIINVSACQSKRGFALGQLGRSEEALQAQLEAIDTVERARAIAPQNVSVVRSLEINHNQAGAMLVQLEQTDEAAVHFRAALELAEALVQADPGDPLLQSDLAYTHNKNGELMMAVGRPREALKHFEAGLAIRGRLIEQDASNASFMRDYGTSLAMVGETLRAIGQEADEPVEERRASLVAAGDHFQRSHDVFQGMRERQQLTDVDKDAPERMLAERDSCEAAAVQVTNDE